MMFTFSSFVRMNRNNEDRKIVILWEGEKVFVREGKRIEEEEQHLLVVLVSQSLVLLKGEIQDCHNRFLWWKDFVQDEEEAAGT